MQGLYINKKILSLVLAVILVLSALLAININISYAAAPFTKVVLNASGKTNVEATSTVTENEDKTFTLKADGGKIENSADSVLFYKFNTAFSDTDEIRISADVKCSSLASNAFAGLTIRDGEIAEDSVAQVYMGSGKFTVRKRSGIDGGSSGSSGLTVATDTYYHLEAIKSNDENKLYVLNAETYSKNYKKSDYKNGILSGDIYVGLFASSTTADFKNVKLEKKNADGEWVPIYDSNGSTGGGTSSTNVGLSSLTLTPGISGFVFESDKTTYDNLTVGYSIDKIAVTPVAQDKNSTINVNGTNLTTGMSSISIGLSSGVTNTINIAVTAEDTVTTKTYKLNIFREENTNPNAPPVITLNCADAYDTDKEYTVEVISNKEGFVDIEINGNLVQSLKTLVKANNVYKYIYKTTIAADKAEIFATVYDTANNTATAYKYAAKNTPAVSPITMLSTPQTVENTGYSLSYKVKANTEVTVSNNGNSIYTKKYSDDTTESIPVTLTLGSNYFTITSKNNGSTFTNSIVVTYKKSADDIYGNAMKFLNADGTECKALTPKASVCYIARIENTTGAKAKYSVILALYDKEGKLVSLTNSDTTLDANGTQSLTTNNIVLPEKTVGYTLKGFLWDNVVGAKAYTDAIELQ